MGVGSSILGAIPNLIGSIGSTINGAVSNKINKEISEQNLAFEQQNFEYQKELQQNIFDREDTSYQRTVSDMRNAGLNPLTMKGTNSSGQAIQTTAPQNRFQHNPESFNNAMNVISGLSDKINQNRISKAQVDNLNAQTESQNIANETARTRAYVEIGNLLSDIKSKNENTNGTRLDNYDKEQRNKTSDDMYKETLRSLQGANEASEYELEEKKKNIESNENFWQMLGIDSRTDPEAKALALDIMASTGWVPDTVYDKNYVEAQRRSSNFERVESRKGIVDNLLGLAKDVLRGAENTVADGRSYVRKGIEKVRNFFSKKNKD